jgi:integrase
MARQAQNIVAAQDRSIDAILKKEAVRQSEVGERRQSEWKVDGIPGLRLVLMKSGEASYHLRFMAGEGVRRKQQRKAIGRANGPSSIGLAKARSIALVVAKDGPSILGIDTSSGDLSVTLRRVFDQFEAWNAKPGNGDAISPRTLADYRDQLERDVFNSLGDVPVAEITKKDVVALLTKAEARSANAAHKARAALGSLYRWAAKRDIVSENFMLGMGFTHKNKARERIASDAEIRALWAAINRDDFNATPSMRLVLKLAILTGQRNSEVAGAKKSELHVAASLANPYWQIPKVRMKRKYRDQHVFLSSQAVSLFRDALDLAGDDLFVFPAKDGRSEHLAQDSVSHAFARARELAGIEDLTLHDMRKAITTWLGDRGERGDVLDRIQHHHGGHATGNRSSVTDSHYNFSVMAEPLRAAWQRWGDHVENVARRKEKKSGKMVHPRTKVFKLRA